MASINQIMTKATLAAIKAFGDSLIEQTGMPVFYHKEGLSFVATPRELISFGTRYYIGCFQIDDQESEAGWMLGRVRDPAVFDRYKDKVCTVSFENKATEIQIFDGGMGWQLAAAEVGGSSESAKDIFEGES